MPNVRYLAQQLRSKGQVLVAEAFDAVQTTLDKLHSDTSSAIATVKTATSSSSSSKPGPVSGIAAHFERYLDGDKKERGQIVIDSFTPPALTNYDGNAFYAEDPDASATDGLYGNSSVSGSASFSGGASGAWPIKLITKRPYIASEKIILPGFDPQKTARNVRIRINTYSDKAGENDLDRATTPSVVVTVPAATETNSGAGGKGEEYCKNPINPTGNVEYSVGADGVEIYRWIGSAEDPADGKCASYVVYADNRSTGKRSKISNVTPVGRTFADAWQPVPAYTVFDLYFVGVDRNGKENTIQVGVTTRIQGIVVEPQTAGGVRGERVVNIVAASFASGLGPVNFVNGLPSLPNPAYPTGAFAIDTSVSPPKMYRNNAGTWTKEVDGGDVKARSITGISLVVGAVSTAELFAGEILVGQGGGKPTRFKVVDSLGNMIGFVGDDSTVPFVGSYFKNIRIAPTIGTTSPRIEASGSGISLTGATFTLESSNTITELLNVLDGTYTAGLRIRETPGNKKWSMAANRLWAIGDSGNLAIDFANYGEPGISLRSSTGADAIFLTSGTSPEIRILGQKVVGVRQARPTDLTGVINVLVAHGLTS